MSMGGSTLEKVLDYASESVFSKLKAMERNSGERPFMGKRLTDQEKLDEYKAERAQPYSMLNRMEMIRLEIESFLGDMSPEEREAEGVSDEAVRKAAVSIVLKYVADMLKISEKLNDPVVGSAAMPLPPPDPPMLGEEQAWPSSTTFSPEPSVDLAAPLPTPPLPPQPQPLQTQPLLPPGPPPSGLPPL